MPFTATVSKGKSVKNQTITNGGTQYVYGSATSTIIKGTQIIKNGGQAFRTTISKGGKQLVSRGTVTSTTILTGGKLIVHSGGRARALTVKSGTTLGLTGNAIVEGKTNLSGTTFSVSGRYNVMDSVTTNANTKINLNINAVRYSSQSYANALTFNNNTTLRGAITISMDSYSTWGNYLVIGNAKIADNTKVTLDIGGEKFSMKYHNKFSKASSLWLYGNNYVVHGQNSGYITVSVHGTWHTRNHKFKTLTKSSDSYYHHSGTNENDFIYAAGNTKFNDKVILGGGLDVVAYDKTKWGQDIIAKTNGTCNLLFKDLTSKDITKKLSGTTMKITKKSDSKQTITIYGWSNNTHKIVYGSGLGAIDKYINTAKPTTEVCTSAYNQAFNKVGLANCAVKMSNNK